MKRKCLERKNLTPGELRAIQLHELECMAVIDRICRTERLRYYMAGGTLLGAVRHKGFIPWDNDIDIAMPRKDYEHFLKIAPEQLGEKYFLKHYKTDPFCVVAYAKICENGTVFKEELTAHLSTHHGIFVDIFPLDFAPESRIKRQVEYLYRTLLKRICFVKLKIKCRRGKWVSALVKIPSMFFSRSFLWNRIERNAKRMNSKPTDLIMSAYSAYGAERELMHPEDYGVPVEMEFEGHLLFAPVQAEKLLSKTYGNYMELPPENQRVTHPIVELKLND